MPKDKQTRPLKDLAKESIFNIINHSNKFKIDFNNSIILDLFSGVGSFGLECLSRGVKEVFFIENYIGVLPIVSNMPKDNHSVMQLYLDGFQNNFYTFFYVDEKKSKKLNNKIILPSHKFLKNKSISKIIYSQKKASENIFLKKNIPFRSFEVKKRDEKTLGELFSFFILETILLGKALKLNPYDQPAVELIKKETKKILT